VFYIILISLGTFSVLISLTQEILKKIKLIFTLPCIVSFMKIFNISQAETSGIS